MALAEALSNWIPDVLQDVECFYSTVDIRAGQRWGAEIASQLAKTDFGILCVTPENIGAAWLNFEAGALSKLEDSRVVPVTLGFSPGAVEDPLRQFNGVEANQQGFLKLVKAIADVAKSHVNVDRVFDRWWSELETAVSQIPGPDEGTELPSGPTDSELIKEIHGMLSGLAQNVRVERAGAEAVGDSGWDVVSPSGRFLFRSKAVSGNPVVKRPWDAAERQQLVDSIAWDLLNARYQAHKASGGEQGEPPTEDQIAFLIENDPRKDPEAGPEE